MQWGQIAPKIMRWSILFLLLRLKPNFGEGRQEITKATWCGRSTPTPRQMSRTWPISSPTYLTYQWHPCDLPPDFRKILQHETNFKLDKIHKKDRHSSSWINYKVIKSEDQLKFFEGISHIFHFNACVLWPKIQTREESRFALFRDIKTLRRFWIIFLSLFYLRSS